MPSDKTKSKTESQHDIFEIVLQNNELSLNVDVCTYFKLNKLEIILINNKLF